LHFASEKDKSTCIIKYIAENRNYYNARWTLRDSWEKNQNLLLLITGMECNATFESKTKYKRKGLKISI